jgi:hypothetical protein
VIPEVHNKEHIIEPVESEPITSSPFEETPKPEPVREPSPGNFLVNYYIYSFLVFQPEERYEPVITPEPVAPVERPEEKTIIVESVPEAPKSAEPGKLPVL